MEENNSLSDEHGIPGLDELTPRQLKGLILDSFRHLAALENKTVADELIDLVESFAEVAREKGGYNGEDTEQGPVFKYKH